MSPGTLALLKDNELLRAENAQWLKENDRLRAENAELNKALQKMITEGIARAEAKLILAKTASHQPASDQEPQKSS